MSEPTADDVPEREDLTPVRDQYRQQLLALLGGWSGTVITAIPTVVFVVVNAIAGLRPAIVSAVGSAVLLAGYRVMRKQPVQQAVTGMIGVVVAALIAGGTGQARGYFLLGIWTSFAYAAVFAGSLVVRRPLVGLAWEFLDPTPGSSVPWYRRRPLLRAYVLATTGGLIVFLARGIVQTALFRDDATGWLAVTKIVMGYPLFLLAVGFAFWVVSRARRSLTPPAG
jgi:Protein of unknown function (DUF3159)